MSHASNALSESPHRGSDALDAFEISRTGRVAFAWSLSGGVTAGGFLMAAVTLSGHLSSSVAPSAATVLFVLGALAGFVHGGIFGYLGRDLDRPRHTALRGLAVATALLLPALPLAWLAAVMVAMSSATLASRQVSLVVGAGLGWIACAAICVLGAVEGWRALTAAFERWPERRAGTVIVMGVLAILSLTFFLERPTIWFTEVRVTGVGALILALGATAWIALPVVLGVLHVTHKLRDRAGRDRPPSLHPDPRI